MRIGKIPFDLVQPKYEVTQFGCELVSEVVDNGDWRSVVVTGEAKQIIGKEREEAVKRILGTNPTLSPAISIRWVDNWVRENIEVVYRIKPDVIPGRSSVKVKTIAAFAQSGKKLKL